MITLIERPTVISILGEFEELKLIADSFKFQHPERDRIDLYQIYVSTNGAKGWDGFIKPFKWLASVGGELPRGHKDRLLSLCAKYKIKVEDSKLLESPLKHLVADDLPDDLIQADFELDQNQRFCVVEWLKHGVGVCKAAVNSGKTAMFAAAASMIKRSIPKSRIIYITQSERLVRQAFTEFKKFLPDLDITCYGGGHRDETGKDIVICTVAMLHKHRRRLKSEEWFNSFIAVLYDEVHHCAAPSSQEVLSYIPAYFRLGASDTQKEEKVIEHNTITGTFGPVRNTILSEGLIATGRSAKPHIYLVDVPGWKGKYARLPHAPAPGSPCWVLLGEDESPVKAEYVGNVYELDADGNIKTESRRKAVRDHSTGELDFGSEKVPVIVPGMHKVKIGEEEHDVESRWCLLHRRYDKAISQFKERNQLIVEWAKHFADQDMQTVIVCTRTMHIMILNSMLLDVLPENKVRMLFGYDSSAERDATFQWLKETPGAVLVTPLIKEGVSINEIRAGVVADLVADWEVANQIIGRFVRKKAGKVENVAHLVWFVDRQHPSYEKNCLNLLEKLQSVKGYAYHWPLHHPADIEKSTVYDTSAELEAKEDAAG